MSFTAAEKADEAKKEVSYRRRVYARLVGEGRMKQADADRRISIMEAIEKDYRGQTEAEEPRLV